MIRPARTEAPTTAENPQVGAGRSDAGLFRRAGRRLARLPRLWGRSLLFRAVAFTGLLTMLGTGLVAAFLAQQVTTGLFQERFDQIELEASNGMQQIRNEFISASTADRSEADGLVADTLTQQEDTGSQIHRYVFLVPLDDTDIDTQSVAGRIPRGLSEDVTEAVVSDELRAAVAGGTGQYWQSVSFERDDVETPGVIFGTQVTLPPGDIMGLYFLYDFSTVQETLAFLTRIMLLAGLALLVLNMAVAAWVTRSVVSPISQAAEVSERIAAGQLDQRLAVRGEDEIARLGISFNRMASNLQEQITQLANLSKMQQRFVSDVSHELRTPLTTVRMAAEVLHESREDFDPVNQRSTELLYHQVERFQAMLSDLLEMSRFDAGAAELALTDVDLRSLAQDALTTALPLADRSQTPLSFVVQGEGFVVEADPRRIDRILRNLINNAIEHAESRPVDLVIASSPTAVGVAVRDHGLGMSPSEVAHVFDRFWRADPARARTTGGSGLGLSIATEDTRLHHGALDAWGQKGQGSCFRLVLPRRQDEPYRASPLALPPVYRSSDRRRVSMPVDGAPATGEVDHDRVTEQSLNRPKEMD
ncbi:MtrAB system histidine kinase MtrB [Nesterenkonia sp. HG001]|uniref:MtrAB system histidine kinase MtrB n=1 Tax=Nesterenkonia sp. HG001 TaxID=2983207 RepID=UPI002AC5823C|nr:MtrAB system histidine kinase MtrB [Nesterenkonia sp. HG001]MDZ5076255.1 MtrAB system histidine kinase MtrB [Nesterenkonia sp. HG001]